MAKPISSNTLMITKDKGSYGTEMRIHNGYLYFSSVTRVFVKSLLDELVPDSKIELL